MNRNEWAITARNRIFTVLNAKLENKFRTAYPDMYITDNSVIATDPVFPTIFIEQLGNPEVHNDLEGDLINAIEMTTQIHVYTQLEDKVEALDITAFIVDCMKQMCFVVTDGGTPVESDSLVRIVSRYKRVIGRDDTL